MMAVGAAGVRRPGRPCGAPREADDAGGLRPGDRPAARIAQAAQRGRRRRERGERGAETHQATALAVTASGTSTGSAPSGRTTTRHAIGCASASVGLRIIPYLILIMHEQITRLFNRPVSSPTLFHSVLPSMRISASSDIVSQLRSRPQSLSLRRTARWHRLAAAQGSSSRSRHLHSDIRSPCVQEQQ
jgi:hypothetical protein